MKDSSRPEPDALLKELNKEGKGKLKVFLGAAPGVGKTYAMLRAAARRKQDGRDVVIGLVETHGRKETESLILDLEVIPRQTMTYRGKVFQEMDIDALLARKPELALVDEMAHTNIEGSRHAKRYQDIEELLANGIDVYTTLNIQHLESLNDIVQRITRVKVQETLPDSALKLADEIELIDLPPEELIQRLREGKVYMPDQAQMATVCAQRIPRSLEPGLVLRSAGG
jgi:two-component system sensor histidine kinase KdpD